MRLADVRYALRLWKRYPTLVLVAGLSLGLGVGATTTMFSVVNNVAHYELGFKDVDRLAVLWATDKERGNSQRPTDWEMVQAILEHGRLLRGVRLLPGRRRAGHASGVEEARVEQMPVDANGLSITGVAPLLGRTLSAGGLPRTSIKQKEARAIVVTTRPGSDGWVARPTCSASTFHVDGEPRTVIGVMPAGFRLVPWEDDIAFWAANDLSRIPKATWMIAVGRLKPGVTVARGPGRGDRDRRRNVLEARGEKPGGAAARVELAPRRLLRRRRAAGSPSCWARSASCC